MIFSIVTIATILQIIIITLCPMRKLKNTRPSELSSSCRCQWQMWDLNPLQSLSKQCSFLYYQGQSHGYPVNFLYCFSPLEGGRGPSKLIWLHLSGLEIFWQSLSSMLGYPWMNKGKRKLCSDRLPLFFSFAHFRLK